MVGQPQYTKKEIEYVLKATLQGQSQASIVQGFKEAFPKTTVASFGPKQVKYVKQKYGRDPRFNTCLINGRLGKITRAKHRAKANHRTNLTDQPDSPPYLSAQTQGGQAPSRPEGGLLVPMHNELAILNTAASANSFNSSVTPTITEPFAPTNITASPSYTASQSHLADSMRPQEPHEELQSQTCGIVQNQVGPNALFGNDYSIHSPLQGPPCPSLFTGGSNPTPNSFGNMSMDPLGASMQLNQPTFRAQETNTTGFSPSLPLHPYPVCPHDLEFMSSPFNYLVPQFSPRQQEQQTPANCSSQPPSHAGTAALTNTTVRNPSPLQTMSSSSPPGAEIPQGQKNQLSLPQPQIQYPQKTLLSGNGLLQRRQHRAPAQIQQQEQQKQDPLSQVSTSTGGAATLSSNSVSPRPPNLGTLSLRSGQTYTDQPQPGPTPHPGTEPSLGSLPLSPETVAFNHKADIAFSPTIDNDLFSRTHVRLMGSCGDFPTGTNDNAFRSYKDMWDDRTCMGVENLGAPGDQTRALPAGVEAAGTSSQGAGTGRGTAHGADRDVNISMARRNRRLGGFVSYHHACGTGRGGGPEVNHARAGGPIWSGVVAGGVGEATQEGHGQGWGAREGSVHHTQAFPQKREELEAQQGQQQSQQLLQQQSQQHHKQQQGSLLGEDDWAPMPDGWESPSSSSSKFSFAFAPEEATTNETTDNINSADQVTSQNNTAAAVYKKEEEDDHWTFVTHRDGLVTSAATQAAKEQDSQVEAIQGATANIGTQGPVPGGAQYPSTNASQDAQSRVQVLPAAARPSQNEGLRLGNSGAAPQRTRYSDALVDRIDFQVLDKIVDQLVAEEEEIQRQVAADLDEIMRRDVGGHCDNDTQR